MSRIVYVTVRSWEPWCYELVTSLFAVGSLGVRSFLRYRSLVYLASLGLLGGSFVRFWEPWNSKSLTSLSAFGGPRKRLLEASGVPPGDLGESLRPFWGVLGLPGALLDCLEGLGPVCGALVALLGDSSGLLGTLLGAC